MALVVDASVAFKWFVPEPASDKALMLLDGDQPLYAPDLIRIEVANAMWARLRRIGDHRDAVTKASEALPQILTDTVAATDLIGSASQLMFALERPLYDCMYLALAVERDCALVTADDKFARKAIIAGYGSKIDMLR